MSNQPAEVSRAQLGWAFAAAIPFVLSIGLLGFAISTRTAISFAAFWPLLQIFGYVMTLKMAKGDPAHYLVKTQVILHWMIVLLLAAMLVRGS